MAGKDFNGIEPLEDEVVDAFLDAFGMESPGSAECGFCHKRFDGPCRTCYLDGRIMVAECPCGRAREMAILIWKERRGMADFLSSLTKKVVERAMAVESRTEQLSLDLEMAESAAKTVKCPRCKKYVSEVSLDEESGTCAKCNKEIFDKDKESAVKFPAVPADNDDDDIPF